MNCPSCGAANPDGAAECAACQVIFAKWAAKKSAPAPAAAPSPAPASAAPAAVPEVRSGLDEIIVDLPSGRAAYAGYWRRFAALFIDGWILGIAMGVLGLLNNLILYNIVHWLYCTLLESSAWMATPGKRALGLSIVDASGARITWLAANKRYFGKPVWAAWVWIRCFIAFITANKSYGAAAILEKPFLHDRWAGALVVKKLA